MAFATKILVPTDLSVASRLAVEASALLAKEMNADVLLFYVYDPSLLGPTHSPPSLTGLMVDARAEAPIFENEIRNDLERVKHGPLGGVHHVDVEIAQHASPATAICTRAAEVDADLIVLATHGRKGIARFLIGSVTDDVVRRANCPVLTLRSKAED